MQSPGPNSKPLASTSTPAANGENAESPGKTFVSTPTPAEILTNLERPKMRTTKGYKVARRPALRMLTAVRRLPSPAVQVNIGERQVNVSG
jgi:hypothetical protein